MLWALAVPALLLATAAASAPPATVVQLHKGRTYRFTFELQTSKDPSDAELREVGQGLEDAGARDVLVMRGPPAMAMFTQKSAATRTMEIGRVYAPFWKVSTGSVLALRLLSVEELNESEHQVGNPMIGLALTKALKAFALHLSPIPL